jgi:hypothetical protein
MQGNDEWIRAAKARGLGGPLGLLLDALRPLGPLGAQLLYVAQPLAWLVGGRDARHALGSLAQTLETPGGMDHLRQQLDDDLDNDRT